MEFVLKWTLLFVAIVSLGGMLQVMFPITSLDLGVDTPKYGSTGTTASKREGTSASIITHLKSNKSKDTSKSNKSKDTSKSDSKAKSENENIKSNIDEQVPSSVTEGLSLLHVISPYEVEECESTFCPFNQEQSVAIGSMLRAKGAINQGSVTLAAAALQSDIDIAVLAGLQALPALTRTTASEYPSMKPQKSFPFFQDIINAVRMSAFEFEYLVYTNADIILDVDFYNTIQDLISQHEYDFFTINRRTVLEQALYTVENLDEIFTSSYKDHPGYDCFIIKNDIFQRLQLGNVFLGTPPFGNLLLLHLQYHSTKFNQFSSSDVQATYHLGDERAWIERNEYTTRNIIQGICKNESVRALCYAELKTSAKVRTNIHCINLQKKIKKFMKVPKFDFSDDSCRKLELSGESVTL